MAESLRPARGGFLRPFGCGWLFASTLQALDRKAQREIDATRGATQADICFEYKKLSARSPLENALNE